MARILTETIYDCLKDHKILCADEPEHCIYDMWAPVELKSILEDAHVANAVYVHSIESTDPTDADMWCSVTWESAGHLETIGFNYMSENRQEDFIKYERWVKEQSND